MPEAPAYSHPASMCSKPAVPQPVPAVSTQSVLPRTPSALKSRKADCGLILKPTGRRSPLRPPPASPPSATALSKPTPLTQRSVRTPPAPPPKTPAFPDTHLLVPLARQTRIRAVSTPQPAAVGLIRMPPTHRRDPNPRRPTKVSQVPQTAHNARMSCATALQAGLLWRMPTPRRHSQSGVCDCSMRLFCASLACTTRPYPQPPRLFKSTRRTSQPPHPPPIRFQAERRGEISPPGHTPTTVASKASPTTRRADVDLILKPARRRSPAAHRPHPHLQPPPSQSPPAGPT